MNSPHPALVRLAAVVVVAHVAVFAGHLVVVARIPPGLPPPTVLVLATAVNIAALLGLILLWRSRFGAAGAVILVSMVVMLAIGVVAHFAGSGPESVFGVPASDWALWFRVTAVALIVLEVIGCWIGIQALLARGRGQGSRAADQHAVTPARGVRP
ncbi:hypothetical protein [Nocardia sp. CA-135398]|uniref:hypothetical protein n=1 Tax=Nocardia sp. CA-135398 TaxID=3239977 RepID=UPI003D988FF9